MSFLFASSHLPAVRSARPELEEEEEEENVNPESLPRSGGVRASSHLPERREAEASYRALSQRGAQAGGRQLQRTEETEDEATPHQDGVAAAKASGVFDVVREQYNRGDSPHFMDEDGKLSPRPQYGAKSLPRTAWSTVHVAEADSSQNLHTAPHATEDTRPWHMPAITHEDLHSLELAADADAPESRPELRELLHRFNDSQRKISSPVQSGSSARFDAETPSKSPTSPQSRLASDETSTAEAQQNLGAKTGGDHANETPRGLGYALKFIGGTIGDMILNTAVGVFGGPGKHSYNPSPIRRAWHVDGVLPKIDRDAYNRLQDGAEMLAFSLGEASNPGNQIHLGIPLPSWQNRNAPFMSPQEAAQWFKEYHANVKKTGSGEFHIEMNKNLLCSKLVNGTLSFEVARPTEDGMMSGKDMFKAMMEFYGPAVKAIEGNWVDGSNLNRVNELTTGGTPLESAVKMTFTGLQAAAHGYTEVEITHSAGENGHFSDIQVIFKKPGS